MKTLTAWSRTLVLGGTVFAVSCTTTQRGSEFPLTLGEVKPGTPLPELRRRVGEAAPAPADSVAVVGPRAPRPVTPVLADRTYPTLPPPRGFEPVRRRRPHSYLSRDFADIHGKLRNIIIPRLSLEEASVPAVLQYLRQRSRELDPEGEGVNIFLVSPPPDAAPAEKKQPEPEKDDFGFDLEDPEGFGDLNDLDSLEPAPEEERPAEERHTTVTMDLENVPLGEVVRYLCKASGYKHRVEQYAVLVAPPGTALREMETRVYPISGRFFSIGKR